MIVRIGGPYGRTVIVVEDRKFPTLHEFWASPPSWTSFQWMGWSEQSDCVCSCCGGSLVTLHDLGENYGCFGWWAHCIRSYDAFIRYSDVKARSIS